MTSTLVNRELEIALLLGRLDQTIARGEGVTVAMHGEAGIGKTQLLIHLSEVAAARYAEAGLLIGYGQAMMNSLGSDSFQAVRDCLRALTLSAQRSASRELLNRLAESFLLHAPDWVESVPVIGGLLAAGIRTGQSAIAAQDRHAEMNSQLDQLVHFIEDLLERGPIFLILDDLQWADTATVDLVMALALKVRGPLMLVIAYRPGDLFAGKNEIHPVRRAMFRLFRYRDDSVELELRALSAEETGRLVRRITGSTHVSERTVNRIIGLSVGNPLFAETLSRLGESLVAMDRQVSTPRQIKNLLEERLSHLTGEDQRLLETAALIGYSFEVDYLALLARVDVDELYERLHVLFTEHALIRPANPRGTLSRYSIHHPLLAEVLRQRAASNRPRWRRLNQRLLEIIGAPEGWDDELLVRAVEIAVEAGDDPNACGLAIRACARQLELEAFSKAEQLAQVAIEHSRDTAPVIDAYSMLAKSLTAEGNHTGVVDACAQLTRWAQVYPMDPHEELSVKLTWARALRMVNNWDECSAMLHQIVTAGTALGASESVAQARMLKCEIALCGPEQGIPACIDLAQSVYEATTDPILRARAQAHRGLAEMARYDADAAELWLGRAIETARGQSNRLIEYLTLHWLSKKAIACLELERALGLIQQITRISETTGAVSKSVVHIRDLSRTLGLLGNLAESASTFQRFFDFTTATFDRATTTLACHVDELEHLHGRDTADRFLAELGAISLRAVPLSSMVGWKSPAVLHHQVQELSTRPPSWDPVAFAVDALDADRAEAEGAEAIFRFDVPNLQLLRSRLAVGE